MTAPSLSLTQSQAFDAVRAFVLAALPGLEVVKGQANRVPEPKGPDFVILTPLFRERLSTNVDTWAAVAIPPGMNTLAATKITIQVDVYGPASGDNVQILSTLWRDDYACKVLAASGFDVQPLYAGEPRQSPFVSGEAQYEDRWTMEAVLQANPVVLVPQTFADVLTPTIHAPADA